MHPFEIFCLRSGRTIILWLAVALAGFLLHPVLIKAPKPVGPAPRTEAREIADRVNRYCYTSQADGRTCELYARALAAFITQHPEKFNIVEHEQVTYATTQINPEASQPADNGTTWTRAQVDPQANKSPVWVKQAASVIDAAAQAAGLAGQPLE